MVWFVLHDLSNQIQKEKGNHNHGGEPKIQKEEKENKSKKVKLKSRNLTVVDYYYTTVCLIKTHIAKRLQWILTFTWIVGLYVVLVLRRERQRQRERVCVCLYFVVFDTKLTHTFSPVKNKYSMK